MAFQLLPYCVLPYSREAEAFPNFAHLRDKRCSMTTMSLMNRREVLAFFAMAPMSTMVSQRKGCCIKIETSAGSIVMAIDLERAPLTAGNFLQLAEANVFEGKGSFYRSVAPTRDRNPVPINVVQGGLKGEESPLPPIRHEGTNLTGLSHRDGTVSMARGSQGTASSEFFICLGDNPELDYGGKRAADGGGFAAFGHVVSGMTLVRRIHTMPTNYEGQDVQFLGQSISPPLTFDKVGTIEMPPR